MNSGMKVDHHLGLGIRGTPIWTDLGQPEHRQPIRIGMILNGSGRDRSGSHRNGTPRNAMVLVRTRRRARAARGWAAAWETAGRTDSLVLLVDPAASRAQPLPDRFCLSWVSFKQRAPPPACDPPTPSPSGSPATAAKPHDDAEQNQHPPYARFSPLVHPEQKR